VLYGVTLVPDSIGRRNENKADAAFGEGIAVDWDSTGYFSLLRDRPSHQV